MQFRTVNIRKDQCVLRVALTRSGVIDYEQFCGVRATEAEPRAVGGSSRSRRASCRAGWRAARSYKLIDVREQFEWDIARIPGARLVPLATLPTSPRTLDRDREVVVYCKAAVAAGRPPRTLRRGIRARHQSDRRDPALAGGGGSTLPRY